MKIEKISNINKNEIKEIKYKITKTKELEDGVILYLDNKEKLYLSIDNYFKYSISSILGLDDKLYEILKQEEKLYLAYRGALRKLSIKDFTIKQINDYLKIKKGLNNNETDTTINKLIEYGLLDDEKYCENRTNYLNKQLLSNKQIKMKLSKEGISSDLIDKYVIINSEDEYEKARNIALKYSNTIKNKSLNATKQAILTKIVNAGFGYDIGKNAVNSLNLISNNELKILEKELDKAKRKYEKKYEGYELKNQIYSYLLNKGFNSNDVKKVMEV